MHIKYFITVLALSVGLCLPAGDVTAKEKLPPLMIQEQGSFAATTDDQLWFGNFRVGNWPDFFEGVQFPRDAESLNQYFRQMTPNTGPFDVQVVSDAVAALFDRVGPGIMVTHSQGGGGGWFTAIKSENVRAIVSYEPGSNFPFPEDEMPPALPSGIDTLEGVPVPPIFLAQT